MVYRRYIFPRLLDLYMRGTIELRKPLLQRAEGEVIEIGFGSGLNLALYDAARVRCLTALEPFSTRRVRRRVRKAPFPVELCEQALRALIPLGPKRYRTAVSTWTICSLEQPVETLRVLRELLEPDGQLLFLEHGLSQDPKVARRQARWRRVQSFIACGCTLDRPIDSLIKEAGFRIESLERLQQRGVPPILGSLYRGVATRRERVR